MGQLYHSPDATLEIRRRHPHVDLTFGEICMANLHIVCPQCRRTNRIPEDRVRDAPQCGICKSPLFDGRPVEADRDALSAYVERNDLPVVVDFWAPWCGPCRAMAPAFSQAARGLATRMRFVKVNTEAEPALANLYGIRGIPTLVVFRGGREIGRVSGAMDATQLEAWVARTVAQA